MYRETTTGIRDVLDPEWDEVSRIIDFSNCWDDDKPTGDYLIFPQHHLTLSDLKRPPPQYRQRLLPIFEQPKRPWHSPYMRQLPKPKPKPLPEPEKLKPGAQKLLWWRHEMQEISEEALAKIYNLDPAALHEAIQDEWAVIYEFWGGTPEEFRAEMRKPENIDKRRP
jgi:hypothetical protein